MEILDLENVIKSNSPLIWVKSKEYERCENTIEDICSKIGKHVFIWDIDKKIYSNKEKEVDYALDEATMINNPFEFIKDKKNSILIMKDMHTNIKEVSCWRAIANTIPDNNEHGNCIIVVSPIVNIPVEISHYFVLTKLPLPDEKELLLTLERVIEKNKIKMTKKDKDIIAVTGLGLTLFEFETALYTSIAYSNKILQSSIFEIKKQIIEKNDSIKVYNSTKGFDTLCGMNNLKQFVKKMVLSGRGKGVLVVGVPGSGKTELAKRLGFETNRITIALDFGNLMGSYVGETEAKTKEAFDIIDSMNQSIVFIDEIEKGLSGTSSESDSVSRRQGGQFLKWMQDKKSDSYVVATANDLNSLPAEYLRSGRWDAIFFIDMPSTAVKKEILDIYKNKYKIDSDIDVGKLLYTGAEIESLCRIASNLKISLKEANEYICPIMTANKESIEILRSKAKKIAIPADVSNETNNNIIKRI